MLQQQDVNELLTTLIASQETNVAHSSQFAEVKIYDFARPDNIPSEFLHALEQINTAFARHLAGMLTSYLTVGVQVAPLATDDLTFRQFCSSVPETTAIGTFNIAPLEGNALLEFNPHLVWYLLDHALGGAGEVIEKPRAFTSFARGLVDDLFRRILREFSRAWEPFCPLQPKLNEVFSDPLLTRICQPEDRMIVCSFAITLPNVSGMSSYCIPVYNLDFERLLTPMGEEELGESEVDPEFERRRITDSLLQTPLQLQACLRNLTLPLRDLIALQEGDLIHCKETPDDPIEIRIANERGFLARVVTVEGAVAVEILEDWKD